MWILAILLCFSPVYLTLSYCVFQEMIALHRVKMIYEIEQISYFWVKSTLLSLVWIFWIWFPNLRNKWI